MGKRRSTQLAILTIFGALPVSVQAAETVVFSYDALGRLVQSQHSGGPASGLLTTVQYDAAGNRSNVAVTGAPAGGGTLGQVIVIPMNGLMVIAL